MPRQLLDRGDIGAGVQEFGHERAPQVMRRARRDPRLMAADLESSH